MGAGSVRRTEYSNKDTTLRPARVIRYVGKLTCHNPGTPKTRVADQVWGDPRGSGATAATDRSVATVVRLELIPSPSEAANSAAVRCAACA